MGPFFYRTARTVSHSEDRPPGPPHGAVINLSRPRRVEIRAGHWIELREALHENMASKMEA